MQGNLDRILNGEFKYETGTLFFSEDDISFTSYPGETPEGSFRIWSDQGLPVEGEIFSSNPRFICRNPKFNAINEEIFYSIDTLGLKNDDRIEGSLTIISNAGEYILPFDIQIVRRYPKSSLGEIRNLFHFTNLARKDFDEAVKLFYSPGFIEIFNGPDSRFRSRYRIFSGNFGNPGNVEEFLISIHKKTPIRFSYDADELDISDIPEKKSFEIQLKKIGWGYIRLSLESDAEFLVPLKEEVYERDFLGNTARLFFQILPEKLHAGKNYATISIRSAYTDLKIPVLIRRRSFDSDKQQVHLEGQRLLSELMKQYIQFRFHEIDGREWCRLSYETVEKLQLLDGKDPEIRLYMVQVLIAENRRKEARYILDHVRNMLSLGGATPELSGYYAYLDALCEQQEDVTGKSVELVRKLHQDNPNSFRLLWLLIYLDETLGKDPVRKMKLLKEHFEGGCRSPLIYIEALEAVREKPEAMRAADAFEISVLRWGVRRGLFYEGVSQRLPYFAYRMQGYSQGFCDLLLAYYKVYPNDELLSCIIMQLIRGERSDREAFLKYSEGIQKEMKITRLYESYLFSVPQDYRPLLPQSVLLYFGMKSDVPDDRMALLYANMIRHEQDIPKLLYSYEERILSFAAKCAALGRIDDNYGEVYRYAASARDCKEKSEFLKAICPFVFMHHITVTDDRVRYICGAEDGFVEVRRKSVTDGNAYISFYGGDYEIAYEDGYGRRTMDMAGVRDRTMFLPSEFVNALKGSLSSDIGLAFYLCGSGRKFPSVNSVNEGCARLLIDSEEVEGDFRDEYRRCLLNFYYDQEMLTELDNLMASSNPGDLSRETRAELIRLMVMRGMQKDAYDCILRYGTEGLDPKMLVKLASRMIREEIHTEDPRFLSLVHAVFLKGKYDETVLHYLNEAFQGTARDMRDIWRSCKAFDVDTEAIEERILTQMMYSDSFVGEKADIFRSYVEKGGREKVIQAYLEMNAYEYLVKEKITEDFVFEELLRRHREGDGMGDAAALALTYYYASKEEKDPKVLSDISDLVKRLLYQGYVMNYFLLFRDYVPEVDLFVDRSFIQYRSNPDADVVLHSLLSVGAEERTGYRKERLQNVYQGLFSKNYVLFFGETMQYYITEENGGKSNLTFSEIQELSDTDSVRNDSRYSLLNEMVLMHMVQDENSLKTAMEEYIEKSEIVSELFRLK
ncbi:MAG: DUF5717 family protein [Lachnospiraceae bacterium]|nr:DUF5717 family protein [Lachnospiraceae bacterium]